MGDESVIGCLFIAVVVIVLGTSVYSCMRANAAYDMAAEATGRAP